MATYDPQKGHARPKPASDEPAPVDDLLDVGGDETPEPPESPVPAPPRSSAPAPSPTRAPVPPDRRGPAKKVGIGVAITAVIFALSWAFKRKRSSRS